MIKQILFEAIHESAKVIKEYFDKPFTVSNKEGVNNLVTEVDKKSEEIIINIIKKNFPEHFILSEESGEIVQNSNYKWIVDPIDGTVNYAHRIPICSISIAVEKDGKMILGAVYNPFTDELFFAEKGKGATLNEKSIHVSEQTQVIKSCLVTGFPYVYLDKPNGPLQVFEKLIRKGVPVRRLGSAALDLCWTACGRFDGFYEHQLQAWDSAAGFLIVEEAGGKVTDLSGEYYNPYQHGIVATNGKIHNELIKIINGENL
jgi:Archaeal fructose-1,6-bisphosphatase and related enzymes of inositol monophosphatase family